MTTIPDFLPTLSSGSHSPGDGQACVMEYVSILAGECFSDHPACTDIVLASAARAVNDWMSDEGRHLLIPLIGRLFGTAERSSDAVGVQLAEFVNEYVHEAIASGVIEGSTDQRLADYLTSLLDKFDELTGFNYQEQGRQLSVQEFQTLSDAVSPR